MADKPKDPNELGALWIKNGGRGEYLSGKINGEPVVVFRNDRKPEGSNAPDWRVMRPTKREDRPAASAAVPAVFDDDIPF